MECIDATLKSGLEWTHACGTETALHCCPTQTRQNFNEPRYTRSEICTYSLPIGGLHIECSSMKQLPCLVKP